MLLISVSGFLQPEHRLHPRRIHLLDSSLSFTGLNQKACSAVSTSTASSRYSISRKATILYDDSHTNSGTDSNTKKKLKSFSKRLGLRLSVAIATLASGVIGHNNNNAGGLWRPQAANAASAPVMALPKAEGRDPVTEAMGVHARKMAIETQRELTEMAATARAIEAEKGEAARIQYERDYKQAQQERADAKQTAVQQLKRDLLDQGICPFTDLEGQRQVVALEKGVDLGKIQGTPFYLEKMWESKSPAKSMLIKKAAHRRVVACMVQDMKNREIDPLEYFSKHQDQTEAILDMKLEQAHRLLQQYESNLELYGQITVPKEGEISVKDKLATAAAQKGTNKQEMQAAKAKAKAKAEEIKAAARAEKAKLQADAKAAKETAKAEATRLKNLALIHGNVDQLAISQQSAPGHVDPSVAAEPNTIVSLESFNEANEVAEINKDASMQPLLENIGMTATPESTLTQKSLPSLSIPKVVAGIALAGGGAFSLKVYRDKASADEEERQRQFRLLMGGDSSSGDKRSTTLADEAMDVLTTTTTPNAVKTFDPLKSPTVSPTTAVDAPKKNRLGIKNVFGKKKGERETELMTLVRSDAEAPEFATMMAKMLTFGAPGRFPDVVKLPGGMPMETFSLDAAKEQILSAQQSSGLSLERSAEVFANVVNCLLIQMVDLASTSLKEKNEQLIINAINIVVDFMNHAASLFLLFAHGVTIKPVTYGGDLSKSKLEQMFSIYASPSVMSLSGSGDSDDSGTRVSLLQDVLQINEQKAQGLMMKAMQKNMMEMMKDGKGMEGMEEMMKGLGMDGLGGGMGGGMGDPDGSGPSPEELKEMLKALKEMKDSGSIPRDELDQVKKQFQEAFGSSIDEVVKEANANKQDLSSTDKELVQLMKAIMDD